MTLLEWVNHFEDGQKFTIRVNEKVVAFNATKESIRRSKDLRGLNMDLMRAKTSVDPNSKIVYIDFIDSGYGLTLGELFKMLKYNNDLLIGRELLDCPIEISNIDYYTESSRFIVHIEPITDGLHV